jgi:hypothetical protein
MNLVIIPLDKMLGLDTLLPLLHSLFVLVFTRQHGNGDGDALCVLGVNHGRVACSSRFENAILLRREIYYLAAPAEAHDTEFLHASMLCLDLVNEFWNTADGLGRCSSGLEEFTHSLFLFFLYHHKKKNKVVRDMFLFSFFILCPTQQLTVSGG